MTEVQPTYDAGPAPTAQAWRALAVTVAATAAALLVDRTVYELFNAPNVYDKDFGKLLRVMGFAGTWVALALAVGLQHGDGGHAPAAARRRGWLLFWSPMLAGALAEVLKIVVRRERPALNDGAYGFRPWDERTWSGAGLAFPSSHAAVAFGGAFMLARLFPRARWVGIVLAAGCGITRIVARAHFVSDVVFAAGLGWLVSWWLWRQWRPTPAVRGPAHVTSGVSMGVVVALAVGAAVAAPTVVQAQRAVPPVVSAPAACDTYERCALGLLPLAGGIAVVRGVQEEPLAVLGFLVPGRKLDAVFAGDSLAQRHGRQAWRARIVGAILTGTALATLGAASALVLDGYDDVGVLGGLMLAGGAQSIAAVYFQFKADAELSRAVWFFNRRFAAPQP